MGEDKRKQTRFSDYARVDAPDISIFPGVLLDISLSGCLVRFMSGLVDYEADYEIIVTPTRKQGLSRFRLIVRPVRVSDGEDEGTCEVGFSIMRSPGTPQLTEYLKMLSTCEVDIYESMVYDACLPV